MEVFRISRSEYAFSLRASGALNRWNLEQEYVIYTASSRSLATLELIVHRAHINAAADYKVMVISLPDDKAYLATIDGEMLPADWRKMSAYPVLQRLGSKWYREQEKLLLRVPSAVIPLEFNYVVNARHPEFQDRVKIVRLEDYFWDKRLSTQ